MSEIRVDKIQPVINGSTVTLTGITTFSGTGSLTPPGGLPEQRTSSASRGQIRFVQGDIGNAIEYYNGTSWIQI
jgi:hypothetical protein